MAGYSGPELYKRGKIWWARLPGGKRQSTKCKGRRAAELAAGELERRAADPAYRAASETGLDELFRRFRHDRRQVGRSEATIGYYKLRHGALIGALGAETPLSAITRAMVRDYVAARSKTKAGAPTVHKELSALKAALRWAKAEGLYAGDPAGLFPSTMTSGYRPRQRYLTVAEAWRLVEALALPYPGRRAQPAEAIGRAAHAAYILGTACRWGESERAERGDVDPKAGLVRIRGTKTAKAARTVPLLAPARPFVEYALEHAPGGRSGRLFAPWGRSRHALHAACARAGLSPPASANDLRRSLPSWLAQAGVPLDLVADVLGHVDTRMARRVYAVRTPESTGVAIGRLLEAAGTVPALYDPGANQRPREAPVSEPGRAKSA